MNNYFSHDSNARNSDKLLPLRMKYGAEGYGIFFMLLERLRDEAEYMSVKDYNVIAFDLRVDASKIKSIIEEFGLFVFTDDGKYFYSEGFMKRMEIKDAKSKKRSEAGKKGAAKRWDNKGNENVADKNSKAMAMPSKKIASKGKERKVKESKVNNAATNPVALENNAVSFWLNEVDPAAAQSTLESIAFWVTDFSGQDEIVVIAIKEMLENGAKSYKYLDKILKNWESAGLDTPEKVKKHLDGYYSKKISGPKKKVTRKESLPSWIDEDIKETPLSAEGQAEFGEALAKLNQLKEE